MLQIITLKYALSTILMTQVVDPINL